MGWKDIFSKRRNEARSAPPPRAPRDAAETLAQCAAAAVARLQRGQPRNPVPVTGFVAGYLTGFCAEAAGAAEGDAENAAAHRVATVTSTCMPPPDQAGVLLGRHEAQCKTDHLLGLALDCIAGSGGADMLITACDTAADRLQSHEPLRNFRFSAEQRNLLREALGRLPA